MKRFLSLFLTLILLLSFTGCGKVKYKASMESNAEGYVYEDFKEECKINNIKTVIITDEETYNSIFIEPVYEVDFEKEMVLLYVFRNSDLAKFYLYSIEVENGKATIRYRTSFYDFLFTGDINPRMRVFAVKMKKTDITSVEFVEKQRMTLNG